MPTIQYSARSARLSVHKLFASCIRRGLVSRHSIVDSDWLSCDWVMSALSAVLSTRIGSRRKFLDLSCTERTFQMNDFKLISTVEMETRNPVEGYFRSEFPAICSNCGVMADWSCKTLNFFRNFCVFWKNTPSVKIFKIRFQKFSSRHRLTCCVQISWNLAGGKLVKSCVAYLTKNTIFPALQLLLLRGSRPNSARSSRLRII